MTHPIELSVKAARRERVLRMVTEAACAGARCPTNDELGTSASSVITALAREGAIRIEVHAHNWRTVTILKGENRGKSTLRAPNGWAVYRIIDKNVPDWPTRRMAP